MRPPTHCYLSTDAISNALNNSGESTIKSGKINDPLHGSIQLQENLLFYSISGTFKFRHGETIHEIKKDQFAFLKKEIFITYHATEAGASFLVFPLIPAVILEFVKISNPRIAPGTNAASILVTDVDPSLLPCIRSVQFYFSEDLTISHHLSKIKLLELLFILSSSLSPLMNYILDVRERFRPDISHIIEENITNSISISQLARLSGRSVSSFRRDFLSMYNMAPSRWIRDKRLVKAKEMLAATTMTVSSICYELGFESIAHFSRLFKTHFGYPPSAERLIQRKESSERANSTQVQGNLA